MKKIKSRSEFNSFLISKNLQDIESFVMNALNVLIVTILYAINRFFLKSAFTDELNIFFNHYFNDLLVPIVLLSLIDFLLFNKTNRRALSLIKISTIFLSAIFWEFITPLYLSRSVSDIYDLFMYFIGTIIYFGVFHIEKMCAHSLTYFKREEKL